MADRKVFNVHDLPELEPVMKQAANAVMAKHVSFDDFLKLFDEEVHGKIRGVGLADGVTHVVCFENLDMWSSEFGKRSALVVGSKQTYTLPGVLGEPYRRLGDVPSRFQYPVAYASVDALKPRAELQLVEGGAKV